MVGCGHNTKRETAVNGPFVLKQSESFPEEAAFREGADGIKCREHFFGISIWRRSEYEEKFALFFMLIHFSVREIHMGRPRQ